MPADKKPRTAPAAAKTAEPVAAAAPAAPKKEKRLEKHGFFAEKGKFGYVKKTARKSRRSKK